jgi:response regulator NasT
MEVEKKLQERKFVEKAKGLLMSRYGFTEEKAYEYLKKKSMDKGTPIIKIAKSVIEIIEKKNQESI